MLWIDIDVSLNLFEGFHVVEVGFRSLVFLGRHCEFININMTLNLFKVYNHCRY